VTSRALRGVVHRFDHELLGDVRPAALVFIAAAMVLLLITCINVANLLLVRGLARVREIAIREALGATKARIVMQLVGENLLLAIGGGALAVGVAAIAVRGFVALAPANIPLVDTVHLDARALLGALGITAAALLMFGLAPAVIAARGDGQTALRSGARQTAGRAWRIAREGLVAAQVALAVLVLSAAALLGRSLAKLERADLAFDASHLLVAELAFRFDRYATTEQQISLMRRLTHAVSGASGVVAASPVVAVPFSGTGGWTGSAGIDDQTPEQAAKNPHFNMELVSPSYFQALGLRAVRGRALTDADGPGGARVVVVNEAMARRYWPNRDPIGEHLRMQGAANAPLTVIGVIPDTRYRELREAPPSVYFPLAQSFFPFAPTTLVVRAAGDARGIVPAVRQAIAESAPGVALASAEPFSSYLSGPLAQPKVDAFLLALFAVAAAALAAVGLFGVMAATVRQRTRELGVRMALGATTAEVQSMIVGSGLRLAAIGGIVGIAGSLVANRALTSLLYGVSPVDPSTLIAVGSFVIATTLLASVVPAWWSARIEPAIALRSEA
jgi:putative ABC transport system permease protein